MRKQYRRAPRRRKGAYISVLPRGKKNPGGPFGYSIRNRREKRARGRAGAGAGAQSKGKEEASSLSSRTGSPPPPRPPALHGTAPTAHPSPLAARSFRPSPPCQRARGSRAHGVGDAPVELGRRVEQRVVGRGGGRGGGGGGAGRLGGAAQRDGRAGARRRRGAAAPAAAARDQGARQVRRRAARGVRVPHCHVRPAEEASGVEDGAAAGGPAAELPGQGAGQRRVPGRLRRQEQVEAGAGRGPRQPRAPLHRAPEERQDRDRQPRHRSHRARGRQARRSGDQHREIHLEREQGGGGADHHADRAADAARGEAGEHTRGRGLDFAEEHSGEAGAEMRGDAGRAQGLQRAAAGGGGHDQMGDVRRAGHHSVGALRLRNPRVADGGGTIRVYECMHGVLLLCLSIFFSQFNFGDHPL